MEIYEGNIPQEGMNNSGNDGNIVCHFFYHYIYHLIVIFPIESVFDIVLVCQT